MDHPKEIQELNDLLKPRWVSGLWNVDHAERPSDPKTRVKAHLWQWHDIYDSLVQAKDWKLPELLQSIGAATEVLRENVDKIAKVDELEKKNAQCEIDKQAMQTASDTFVKERDDYKANLERTRVWTHSVTQ